MSVVSLGTPPRSNDLGPCIRKRLPNLRALWRKNHPTRLRGLLQGRVVHHPTRGETSEFLKCFPTRVKCAFLTIAAVEPQLAIGTAPLLPLAIAAVAGQFGMLQQGVANA